MLRGISYLEDLKNLKGTGHLRVLTTKGHFDYILRKDLGRHIASGYVVAVLE